MILRFHLYRTHSFKDEKIEHLSWNALGKMNKNIDFKNIKNWINRAWLTTFFFSALVHCIAMYNVYVNEGDVYPLRQKFTKGTKIEFTEGKKSKMKCPLREIIHEGENIEFDQEWKNPIWGVPFVKISKGKNKSIWSEKNEGYGKINHLFLQSHTESHVSWDKISMRKFL